MQNKGIKIVFFVMMMPLYVSDSIAKNRLSLSAGATYITGNYGRKESTDIYYVPFILSYQYEKFNFKITLPYLEKTGVKSVIRDIGQVGQRRETIRTTESGIGNVIAAIRYNFFYSKQYKFLMDAEGKVHIGTASKNKGLGTGKTDFDFRLGFYKVFDELTPYARVGYKVHGSPLLRDVFFLSSGVNYKFTHKVSAGFDFSWREKVSKQGEEKYQLVGYSAQKLTKNWSLQEYIIKGFGRSTADWGGGVSINYRFN